MKCFLFLLLYTGAFSAYSQDRYFAQTYTSDILSKGEVDLELWHTSRIGHENQFYHAMDQRMELEVGLGGKVQTAFYFNRFQETMGNDSGSLSIKTELGFSNEWKVKISKPAAKTNIALYGEIGIKGDEVELEGKLILDRAFGRKHLVAFNLVGEVEEEVQKRDGRYRLVVSKTPIELDLGYLFYVHPDLGFGAEIKNRNDINHGWQNSVLYGGPTINYRSTKWFIIVNYLPQWANLLKTSFYPGNKVLDVHERTEARVVVGFSF